METFENFKFLYLARKFPKCFEFCNIPIFYLFKHCVKISGRFNDYFESYI